MINPTYSLSGRKNPYLYADIVDAQTPGARSQYFANRNYQLNQDALDLQQKALEAQMQNYADTLGLTKDQIDYQRQQGNVSNLLGLGSLAINAYPLVRDTAPVNAIKNFVGNVGSGAKNLVLKGTDYLGLTKPHTATLGAPATTAASMATPIASQVTGEIPSTGIIPKPAVDLNQGYDIGDAATKLPSYVYEGGPSDILTAEGAPVESTGMLSQITSSPYFIPAAAGIASVYGPQIIEGAKNLVTDPLGTIRDFGQSSAENIMGFVRNPIGSTVEMVGDVLEDVGNTVNNFVSGAVNFVKDPIGSTTDALGSHFCSAVADNTYIDHKTKIFMMEFRRYCIEFHNDLAQYYFKNAGEVVKKINELEDKKQFYNNLKFELVIPVSKLVESDRHEDAFELYNKKYIELMKKYTPELLDEYLDQGVSNG